MTEADLLKVFDGAYQYVSTPQTVLMDDINAVTKLCVKVLRTDDTKDPPEGDVYVVNYFVTNRGLGNESARISLATNNTAAVTAIQASAKVISDKKILG